MERSEKYRRIRGHLCMPVVLVTAEHEGTRNVMTAAWSLPTSLDPPLVIVSIGTTRFTHDLVMKSGVFALNILSENQADLAEYCGNVSGRDTDKFAHENISVYPAEKISVPLIEHCAGNFECRVRSYFLTGDHTVFVGEIVRHDENTSLNPLVLFRGMFHEIGDVITKDEHPSKG